MMSSVPVERLTPERRRALTRGALIEAAADVFARRGFHGASLDEIAETAGFSRGAIYSNFDGKEDLLLAVLDYLTEEELGAFGRAIDEGMRTGTDPSVAAAGVWGHTREEPSRTLLSLELRAHALRDPIFRARLAQVEEQQQDRIADFIEDQARRMGRTLRIAPRELAEILRATSDGLAQLAAISPERRDYYDRLAQTFFGYIDETISAPPAKASRAKKP